MGEMQGFNIRGYMFLTSVDYLKEALGDQEAGKVIGAFSPEAREMLATLKAADWCPVQVFSEVTEALAASAGGEDKSRELLVRCGSQMAQEATNSFLRLFMKLMSPKLLVKKIPDLWKRDCSRGQLLVENLDEQSVRFATSGMGGFSHAVCTAAGFVSFALGAIGKKVENCEIHGWSLAEPCADGATFELRWSE